MSLKFKTLGSNQTEIKTSKHTVLFSYETPVVVHTHYSEGSRPVVFITNGANEAGKKIRTRTTSGHINSYTKDLPSNWERFDVDQEELENILANA
jgi:hypothetical protein|tara:strand:+ start:3770 stop:4054 length:285 start_codon:yes stop_codon:yes gene_type:complete